MALRRSASTKTMDGSKLGQRGTHATLAPDAVPDDAWVLRVWLKRASDVISADGPGFKSDPYALLRLDDASAPQAQRSTTVWDNHAPVWTPPERFEFAVADVERARLVLSLYDQDLLSADDELGDGVVSLRELARTPPTKRGVAGVDLSIALFDPQSGARLPTVVQAHATLEPKAAAFSLREDLLYELQRHQPMRYRENNDSERLANWGSSYPGHFWGSDPRRWLTVDGARTASHFATLAPAPAAGERVATGWHVFTQLGAGENQEGWQYAHGFDSSDWYPRSWPLARVRRRVWRRVVVRDGAGVGAGLPAAVLDDDEVRCEIAHLGRDLLLGAVRQTES